MTMRKPSQWILAALLAGASLATLAKPTPDQIERLGKDLTPLGAEKAGNKDGSIPAWTGGLSMPISGEIKATSVDLFASDKPLYTITGANADQYKDKLAPGQLALLKRYPTYKMVVYQSRRSAAQPESVYKAVKEEAGQISLGNGGNSVLGAKRSTTPFPIPTQGVEVIWNHTFRYRGDNFVRTVSEFPVQTNGAFTPVVRYEEALFPTASGKGDPGVLLYFRTSFTAPSSVAGEAILAIDSIDQVKTPRQAWAYNAGARRVIRAPELSYNSDRQGVDGLSTIDDYDSFNGSPDRFEWKLLGKREMIISYNNFKAADKNLKYKQLIQAQHMNQDYIRYELHRVWVVEGTLKKGADHSYGKRVYYIDEDSWQIAHGDLYDKRGELWRVLENFGVQIPQVPAFLTVGNAQYDLQARRYVSSGLSNEGPDIKFNVGSIKASSFTSDALRRFGN